MVAQGWWRRRYHFPGMVRLDDGTLLVVARSGYEHVDRWGKIRLMRSTDDGATWESPRTIFNSKGDDRDPKISVTRSGRVFVLFFIRRDKTSRGEFDEGAFVIHSDDAGRTWSDPVPVESSEPGWVASHGAVTEMPDGSLLAPVYQDDRSFVVRSTDGGRSFPAANEYTFDTGDVETNEVTLIAQDDGVVVAWLRNAEEGDPSLVFRSRDSGLTWEGPETSELRQSSADGIQLDDGRLCLAWGDLSGRFGERRVTCASIVEDGGEPWQPSFPTPVWDAFNYDQANPALAQLPDGRIIMVVNDYASRQLVAKYLSPDALAATKDDAHQLEGALDLGAMLADGSATMMSTLGTMTAIPPMLALVRQQLGLATAAIGTPGQESGEVTITFREPQAIREVGVALRPGENQSATIEAADEQGEWHRVGVLPHAWRYGDVDWLGIRDLHQVSAVRVHTSISRAPRPPKSRSPQPAAITHLALR